MNQEKLNEINQISNQIENIDGFVDAMSRSPKYMRIFSREPAKKRIVFRRPAYGFLDSREYTVPEKLKEEVLNVIKDHKEKLISRQKELWGGE